MKNLSQLFVRMRLDGQRLRHRQHLPVPDSSHDQFHTKVYARYKVKSALIKNLLKRIF
jgi:hypothetical protein